MSLNYDIVEAVPVTLVYDRVHFWIVGCGGTGSFLVGLVVRIALDLIHSGKPTKITLVDPDRVEAKNTIRQCFCEAEIGRNKAQTLALRYSLAHSIEIEAVPLAFQPQWITYQSYWGDRPNTLTVLIGCVDRASGRRSLHQALDRNHYRSQKSVWWIDAGNGDRHGQVLVGSSLSVEPNDYRFTKLGCLSLPSPGIQAPELLVDKPEELQENRLSCAELARLDRQNLVINAQAATVAAALALDLVNGELTRFAAYFDLRSGTEHRYITQKAVNEAIASSAQTNSMPSG
ncbi:ThiF family adenylyltransferase [Gloeocapsa sp. BRSZ]|uniref:ThiF family adenylyltransferase n=1 Tax=Gloeocapsopsis sp. IPPAS B-1203 TaxID=2049454 RepID=UPI000C19731E|nr:ThiF family adenylyltransferase [Gloeocapsopsis sp. IPPAS B-1203]PIG91549.1 hypothetical protein CSQ79_20085 [Gloeocapsopsis sp. IPPAS B-1203]